MRRFAAWLLFLCVLLSAAPARADDDLDRMRLLLRQSAAGLRTERHSKALVLGAGGALRLGVGLTFIAREGVDDLDRPEQVFGVVQTVVGGLEVVGSLFPLLFVSEGERLEQELERDAAQHPDDRAGVLDRGEKRLLEAAAGARTQRLIGLVVNAVFLTAEIGVFVGNELQGAPSPGLRYGLGSALVAAGATTFSQLFPSELERLAGLWRRSPSSAIGFAPAARGGIACWTLAF